MSGPTLAETANGPDWVIYVVAVIFFIMTVVLLTGKGANLIAGYNTASKEEKEKYDEKKLSRTVGICFIPITVLILVMAVFGNVIPANFVYIFVGFVVIDVIVILVLCNTICKK